MKKFVALLLCLALVLTGTALAENTLTASTAGFGGDVTVTVTVDENGVIVSARADGSTQTPDIGGAAADKLNEGALAALARP